MAQLQAGRFDVVVTDLRMPEVDGLAVLRAARALPAPPEVVLMTAFATAESAVAAMKAGADDYLVKPFEFEELLARLEGLHRRAGAAGPVQVGAMVVDPRRRTVTLGDKSQKLTDREASLLVELAHHPGVPLSRARLLETVWRGEPVNPNVVDVYVGYLRNKLAGLGSEAIAIAAVRGVGFRLDVNG